MIENLYTSGVKHEVVNPLAVQLPGMLRIPRHIHGSRGIHERPAWPREWTKEEISGEKYKGLGIVCVAGGGFEHSDIIVRPVVIGSDDPELVIKPGFGWDGASGPTWDTKSSMLASCVHDAMYMWLRNDPRFYYETGSGRYKTSEWENWRMYADAMLYQLCLGGGMWKWRARMWYEGVRNFGREAASSRSRRKQRNMKAVWPPGRVK